MAHGIEARGTPTLVISTAVDIMSKVSPPRAVFVGHPADRTFGPPGDCARNETVLPATAAARGKRKSGRKYCAIVDSAG